MKLLIPSYFRPGEDWNRISHKAASMPGMIHMIANPANGPGMSAENDYSRSIRDVRENGVMVHGYVSTRYGERKKGEVKSDIDRWNRFYGVDGIFLDEQPAEAGSEPYYQSIYKYIKKKNRQALVISNPGTAASESYLIHNNRRLTDVMCIYENDSGVLSWAPHLWIKRYEPENFYILAHNTVADDYRSFIDHAKSCNIDWIYLTDDTMPNPWDVLPSYFDEMCDYIFNKE